MVGRMTNNFTDVASEAPRIMVGEPRRPMIVHHAATDGRERLDAKYRCCSGRDDVHFAPGYADNRRCYYLAGGFVICSRASDFRAFVKASSKSSNRAAACVVKCPLFSSSATRRY